MENRRNGKKTCKDTYLFLCTSMVNNGQKNVDSGKMTYREETHMTPEQHSKTDITVLYLSPAWRPVKRDDQPNPTGWRLHRQYKRYGAGETPARRIYAINSAAVSSSTAHPCSKLARARRLSLGDVNLFHAPPFTEGTSSCIDDWSPLLTPIHIKVC